MSPGPALKKVDLEDLLAGQERWRDKPAIAQHFSCSIRWIESRMEEGMPHTFIAGRAKFRVSEVEPWLDAHGFIARLGK
jgi:hypothetical protein